MTATILPGSRARIGRVSNDTRALLIGAACIAVILVAGKGIPRLVEAYNASTVQLQTKRRELVQDTQIISRRGAVARSFDKTTADFMGLSPAFLTGNSSSQAAAALASVATDAADANGVHISSLQPEVDSTTQTLLVPIMVRVSGTGDVRGISGMLRDLESGVPLVEVRQVTIAQPDVSAPADRMEALHVEAVIRGLYRRVPGGPDDKAAQ